MPLIDQTYFFGELLIPNKSSNANSLNEYINEHENRLLVDLLGYELHKLFAAGIAAPSPAEKWLAIRDGKEYTNRSGVFTKWVGLKFSQGTAQKSLIANYVYWHWMQDMASFTTGSGEKTADNQNAVTASPASKMVRAWNQMVEWNRELVEFLLTNATDYPEFQNHYGRIPRSLLKKQNLFNI